MRFGRQRLDEGLTVVPKAIETGGKAMNDCQHVLDHLALWREVLLIEDEEFCTRNLAEMRKQIETEASKAIFVRDDEVAHLMTTNGVDDGRELRPFEIQASTDLRNDLNLRQAASGTELRDNARLVFKIGTLCC